VVHELARIADSPLSDFEKIPITARQMSQLVSPPSGEMNNDSSDVELLFRIGFGGHPLDQNSTAVQRSSPIAATEDSFHSFWDWNVCDILELLLPRGMSTRNNSRHTTTGSTAVLSLRGIARPPQDEKELLGGSSVCTRGTRGK